MKKIPVALATLLFVVPSVSFAAALTPQQSSSLIAVVQSSPGTPASAFVSLITAFSNITVNQATSLITVVQAAPGVPANAFVNLLTSFTADVTPVIITPPAQNTTPVVSTSSAPTTVLPTQMLSVKLGVVTVTRPGTPGYASYHAHLDWSTNIPTNSKVFFAPTGQWQNVNPDGSVNSTYFLVPIGNPLFGYMGATTAVIANSASGNSTMHSVELNNLQEKYQYSYTIEAISGTLDQKITGTFDTK